MSVSNLALHPKKSILATASDDATWKMWDLPSGDLIMSGDGHKDWVAGVNFHPAGTHLASASVGRCGSIPVETRVESACLQRLKLEYDNCFQLLHTITALNFCIQFQLAPLHLGRLHGENLGLCAEAVHSDVHGGAVQVDPKLTPV